MLKTILNNRRAILYGLVIAIGIVFLQQIAASSSLQMFLAGAVVLGLILGLELYVNYHNATNLLRQLQLPNIAIYTKNAQTIYHALLPALLYISLLGFIYTNNQLSLSWLYFLLSFLLFSILFINIGAYYEDKFKLEENTHLVYDLIKIFVYFTFCNSLLNISLALEFNFYITVGLIFVVSSLLTFLILLRRKHYSYYNLLLIIFSGLAIGYITGVILELFSGRTLLISFYSTMVFYLFNAVLHHELDRSLSFSMIFEYILIACISLLVLFLLP